MLRRLVIILACIVPLAARAPAQAPAARSELQRLFAAAQSDPAGVVALILSASQTLGTLTALEPREAQLLGDTLDTFARRAFFGPERLPGMERLGLVLHTVEKGDVPGSIAQRHHIGAGLLAYLNDDFDEKRLRIGQELKVLDLTAGDLQIVVQKSLYRLFTWRKLAGGDRALIACIPVGLGAAASPTPLGRTTITKRVLNPEWTNPATGQVLPAGDPGNVLGGYWIALDSQGIGKSGIGLHGFTGSAPSNWIEQPASNGCLRLLQPDIDRVFHLALEGTTVSIQP